MPVSTAQSNHQVNTCSCRTHRQGRYDSHDSHLWNWKCCPRHIRYTLLLTHSNRGFVWSWHRGQHWLAVELTIAQWSNKRSQSKLPSLILYELKTFSCNGLKFRALVSPSKSLSLDHETNETNDSVAVLTKWPEVLKSTSRRCNLGLANPCHTDVLNQFHNLGVSVHCDGELCVVFYVVYTQFIFRQFQGQLTMCVQRIVWHTWDHRDLLSYHLSGNFPNRHDEFSPNGPWREAANDLTSAF